MNTFNDDLELINHLCSTHTFDSKDYDDLITDIGETYGHTVVGSSYRNLRPLAKLYAKDAGGRFGVLYTDIGDFRNAVSFIRRENPMPPKARTIHVPIEYSHAMTAITKAIELELHNRAAVQRLVALGKYKQTCEMDEDGRAIPTTIINASTKIMDGLLKGEKAASDIFKHLMIVRKAYTYQG